MSTLSDARFQALFATPVMEHAWPGSEGLNARLREAVLAEALRAPGVAQTNVGGWHSAPGTLEFCGEAGQALVRRMVEMTQEATLRLYAGFNEPPEQLGWSLSAWANVNRRGDYNAMHTHPGATWSGVYFVDDGDGEEEGTPLMLSDPCPTRTSAFFPGLPGGTFSIRPVPGLMVLFPGYLPHVVPPHRGARPRISIAFNLTKDPFP